MSCNYNLEQSYINNKKKLDILIVDDDIDSSELFKEYLSLRGHNVFSLDEGVKCISKCMKNKYDIIFLDYHIGDIDGVELADCLKDVLKTKSLIYAYTGDNSPEAIKKFKEIGMNGAIIKPINLKIINNYIIDIEQQNIKNKFNILNCTF
jgi:PleD family two-component response regulator